MLEQNEARIFLAEKRGLTIGTNSRRFHTFNDEPYAEKSSIPFGNLKVLNDEVLGAEQTHFIFFLKENSILILLPIVGGLAIRGNEETEYIVAGQVAVLTRKMGDVVVLENPYADKSVNFLQIQLSINNIDSLAGTDDIINLSLENNNQLLNFGSANIPMAIGQYNGRNEGVYQLKTPKNGLFAFVIEGAFEVQNRLLEKKDGLALWNLAGDAEIEFEALSNNAIILFIEVQLN